MKIWMFVYDNCKHDARVLKEAKTLAEAGHNVKIAAVLDRDTAPVETKDGFRIMRVKKGRIHGPLSLLTYYRNSWKLVKNDPADVYHCHDLNTLLLGYLPRRYHGGKLVYDAHELTTELAYIPRHQKLVWKVLEKFLIKKADAVIVPGQYRGEFLAKKYNISPPTVILNCPPLRHEPYPGQTLREKLGLADSPAPVILYTGGYVTGRGLRNLVRAAPYLTRGVLVFLGWGPLEKELRALAREKGLEKKVLFLDPVPPDALVDCITPAALGVVIYQNTGLNSYYAAPNKLYEYIHAGLPVAGSYFPALKEIIEGYGFGSTFDPEEPESIAAAINSILGDGQRYAIMRENALKAAKIFNWETESVKLLGIYRRLSQRSDDTSA